MARLHKRCWWLVALATLAILPTTTDLLPVQVPLACSVAEARGKGGSVYVTGYIRKDGTYVSPHMRSAPDGNFCGLSPFFGPASMTGSRPR